MESPDVLRMALQDPRGFLDSFEAGDGAVLDEIQRVVVGKRWALTLILTSVLARGHVLIEDLPGLGKTLIARSFAAALGLQFTRVQFTPDLLPGDVTGTDVFRPQLGTFEFQAGPIFHNLVLADEINRAPAKVQSALLEAMAERQVSVGATTYPLPALFLVMATQNPIEQEGTYPLPEAQLDRFLMHVMIDYPDDVSELGIMRLNRKEQLKSKSVKKDKLSPQVIFDARDEIAKVSISENMEKYIVDIVSATRTPEKYGEDLNKWIEFGGSPRASIAIDRAARTHAWMNENDFVTPENIRAVVHDCLRHRLILSYEANAEGISPNKVIDELLKLVAVLG